MAYTNVTEHYELPQYIGTDVSDWNDNSVAFKKIDDGLFEAKDTADKATGRIELLENRATETETKLDETSDELELVKATANSAFEKVIAVETDIDSTNVNIGNLNNLLTPDKSSIVNAINSLMALLPREE